MTARGSSVQVRAVQIRIDKVYVLEKWGSRREAETEEDNSILTSVKQFNMKYQSSFRFNTIIKIPKMQRS